jgi:DNA-binding GntR family transcriptional regulator
VLSVNLDQMIVLRVQIRAGAKSSRVGRAVVAHVAGPERAAPDEWLADLADEVRRAGGIHYRAVAAALRGAIASGRVPVGAQLPAERELARLLGVGRTTIVAAYNLLRVESLIRSRRRAGTWVVRRPERCSR